MRYRERSFSVGSFLGQHGFILTGKGGYCVASKMTGRGAGGVKKCKKNYMIYLQNEKRFITLPYVMLAKGLG